MLRHLQPSVLEPIWQQTKLLAQVNTCAQKLGQDPLAVLFSCPFAKHDSGTFHAATRCQACLRRHVRLAS